MESLKEQIGGSHYQGFKIQPVEFIRANKLSFCEGNVVKYTVRRKGSRLEDLKKARHYVDMLIEDEMANEPKPRVILECINCSQDGKCPLQRNPAVKGCDQYRQAYIPGKPNNDQ